MVSSLTKNQQANTKLSVNASRLKLRLIRIYNIQYPAVIILK